MRNAFLLLICFLPIAMGAIADDITIDCDFPGGNIQVKRIEGNHVYIHPDLRDTEGDWFYWYFRVKGAHGQTLTFHFTQSNPIGVLGPAVSIDAGQSWSWLGKKTVDGTSFTYRFPDNAGDVRFCMGIPYQEHDLTRFLSTYSNHPSLRVSPLCTTKKGRTVEKILLGNIDGQAKHKVLLTGRHHSCEMAASYTLEGMMAFILTDTETGAWLRQNVEFLVIPFMDKDGVEDGDQGKNRKPRDHNRDYSGQSLYASVRTLREQIPAWADNKLHFFLDMHAPYIRGKHNEWIYFVGGPNQAVWQEVMAYSAILENIQQGPLRYDVENNLPFGQAWNTSTNQSKGQSASRWASELPGIRFAATIEIPYAHSSGQEITAHNLRALGHDLCRALHHYLQR